MTLKMIGWWTERVSNQRLACLNMSTYFSKVHDNEVPSLFLKKTKIGTLIVTDQRLQLLVLF
jgi:hypothetical protein